MEIAQLVLEYASLWNPVFFAALVGLAAILAWMAFAPSASQRDVGGRLDEYLDRGDIVLEEEFERSLFARVLWPALRAVLRILGRFLPRGNFAATGAQLQQAGSPGGMGAMDYYGLRVLTLLLAGALAFFWLGRDKPLLVALQISGLGLSVGFILPLYWLRVRVRQRKNAIVRALPDGLDMLTIGVEAGLAFESAMLRVGEKWDNPLTQEFRRTVAEMNVGMSRERALTRMAERCDVPDLSTFVGVLVQSSQLGVSISHVLHSQANDLRIRRRQRAEELARKAGIKMIFPLAMLILPALFVVVLGPTAPRLADLFSTLAGTGELP